MFFKSVLLQVGTILSLNLLPLATHANEAIVLTDTICSKPNIILNAYWGQQNFNTNNVFFMSETGDIHPLQASITFDRAQGISVFSEGTSGKITSLKNPEFVNAIAKAHPTAPTQLRLFAFTSSKDDSTPSLPAMFQKKYNNGVGVIVGHKQSVMLAGTGQSNFRYAQFRHVTTALQNDDIFNIKYYWNTLQNVDGVSPDKTMKYECTGLQENISNAKDRQSLNKALENMNAFRKRVLDIFLPLFSSNLNPPHNYWQAIKDVKGENVAYVCGSKVPNIVGLGTSSVTCK